MKILIPVDGSKFSKAAVDFVASRTTLIGKHPEIELLNVQAPLPSRAASMIGKLALKTYHETESARTLKSAVAKLTKAGIVTKSGYALGSPAEAIAARADRHDIDLIAMGSHGHGALMQLLFGSVTHGVLAQTKKPVLLLRNRAAPKSDSLRVGIATDGSRFGRAAVNYVLKHITLFGSAPKIELIYVAPDFSGLRLPERIGVAQPPLSFDEIEALRREAFVTAVGPLHKLFAKAGQRFDEACLVGPAADQITAYAKKRKFDVLVMGSHGQGAFKRAILGSVVSRVAQASPIPLLLVRET